MNGFPLLSLIILIPLLSALFIFIFVKQSKKPHKILFAKYIALMSSAFTLIATIYLMLHFDKQNQGFQFVEQYNWIESIGMQYYIGIDGISLFFIVLTALLTPICILSSLYAITKRIKEFLICFLLLESFVIGAFCALDIMLFYIFFEVILIPMYLIIGIWGGENRIYATIKFFIYTFFGSIFFLISIIYIYTQTGSLAIPELMAQVPKFDPILQNYIWVAMFIAFAVKIPMWPVHTWLPDAHVQAPTAGSVILAGILLKLGGYGFLRFSLPMLPDASLYFADFVIILSIIAIIYASLVAFVQSDMKKMIAYSSIAHMGYVTAGIFSFSVQGLEGAIFQMISHGLISSGLFLVVGCLYDRMHTKEIERFGGVAFKMPVLATLFMILTLASIGVPGTSGFVGEFLALYAVFSINYYYGALGAIGVILGALYMLSLYRRTMLGTIIHDSVSILKDLSVREIVTLMPLVILIILLGIKPGLISCFYSNPVEILSQLYK